MTIKRAERLTGYEIRELPLERGQVTLGAFDGTELVVKASGRVEWMALKALVYRVYVLHSRIAMQRHDWRCCTLSVAAGRCRFITENIVRTVGPTRSTTWSRFAGIATE